MQETTKEILRGERGDYRALEWVAGGGFGSVFFGRALASNQPVAIKRLHAHFVQQPRMVARFEHEAALVLDRGLRHDNVVRVLDRGRDEQRVPFFVMEWVEGWTVAHLLEQRRRLSIAEAVAIGCQALAGLAAAHALNVVHRDVKPSNLMVTPHGQVMVMDLGIAKETDPDLSMFSHSTNLGTWIYAAPEHIDGDQHLDGRTDLYALGTTLYHVLAGVPPFTGAGRDRRPPALPEDVPRELARVVWKAMAKDRAERFHSAVAMAQALRPFAPSDLRVPVPERTPRVSNPQDQLLQANAVPDQVAQAKDLQDQGKLDEAVTLLAQLYRQVPSEVAVAYAEALGSRAEQCKRQHDLERARADYQAAIDIAPAGELRDKLVRALKEIAGPPDVTGPPHVSWYEGAACLILSLVALWAGFRSIGSVNGGLWSEVIIVITALLICPAFLLAVCRDGAVGKVMAYSAAPLLVVSFLITALQPL